MSTPAELAATLGHEAAPPVWRTTSAPPVDPARFGQDHWSTFAYVETRTVDYRGTLGHVHMRCHRGRHPIMMAAKGSGPGVADGSAYPTRLAGGEELHEHDDYDCIDDLIAAGLLEAHMPELRGTGDGAHFVSAFGRPISDVDGRLIRPDFVTGLSKLYLCAHATFSLTERGRQVASSLRAHKAAGGSWAAFRME